MNDTHETIADIIAKKRRQADKIERNCAEMMKRGKMISDSFARELVADIRREADRLEAAWKREKAAIEADALEVGGIVEAAHKRELSKNVSKNGADFGQLGDAAKLREALIDVVKRLEAYTGCDHHTFHPTATTCDGITSVGKCGKIGTCAAIFKARAALAEPVKNCEVGTPKEQEDRWKTNCGHGIPNCKHCKVYEQAKNSGLVNSRYFMRCDCRFIWAQMPYMEQKGESNGSK